MTYYIISTVLHSETNVLPSSSSHAVYSPAQETEITRVKYVKNNPHCTKSLNIPHIIKQTLRSFVEGASERRLVEKGSGSGWQIQTQT